MTCSRVCLPLTREGIWNVGVTFVVLDPNETLRPEIATEIRSNTFLFTQKYIGRELDIESFDQLMGQVRVFLLLALHVPRTFSIVATVLDLQTRALLTGLQPQCFPSQIIATVVEIDIFIFLEM